MTTQREGRRVHHAGAVYEFRTVEQAEGFLRGVQQGKSLETCRRAWRPTTVRVTAVPAGDDSARLP